MPQAPAGLRIEPPVSVPIAPKHKRAATAAPALLDGPPGARIQPPRIPTPLPSASVDGTKCGKLDHVCLAEDNSTGALQASYDFGVDRGERAIASDGTRGGSAVASKVHIVFQCDWDAVQRPAPSPASKLEVEHCCPIARVLFGDCDERIEQRLIGANARQAGVREVERRVAVGIRSCGGQFGSNDSSTSLTPQIPRLRPRIPKSRKSLEFSPPSRPPRSNEAVPSDATPLKPALH